MAIRDGNRRPTNARPERYDADEDEAPAPRRGPSAARSSKPATGKLPARGRASRDYENEDGEDEGYDDGPRGRGDGAKTNNNMAVVVIGIVAVALIGVVLIVALGSGSKPPQAEKPKSPKESEPIASARNPANANVNMVSVPNVNKPANNANAANSASNANANANANKPEEDWLNSNVPKYDWNNKPNSNRPSDPPPRPPENSNRGPGKAPTLEEGGPREAKTAAEFLRGLGETIPHLRPLKPPTGWQSIEFALPSGRGTLTFYTDTNLMKPAAQKIRGKDLLVSQDDIGNFRVIYEELPQMPAPPDLESQPLGSRLAGFAGYLHEGVKQGKGIAIDRESWSMVENIGRYDMVGTVQVEGVDAMIHQVYLCNLKNPLQVVRFDAFFGGGLSKERKEELIMGVWNLFATARLTLK